MCKWTIGKIIIDKCLLVVMSIIVLGALVGSIYILEKYATMSKEWIMFIFFCTLFVLITTYKSADTLKRIKFKWSWTLLLIVIELLMIIMCVVAVYNKLLALPQRGIFIWTFAVLVISYMTSSIFSSLVNRFGIKN